MRDATREPMPVSAPFAMTLDCNGRALVLDRPRVMGILNVTPDSFSDGGRYCSVSAAREHAIALCEAGADIIDVGGVSTRPGAEPVAEAEELARVIPVVTAVIEHTEAVVSVDTSNPAVMRAAVEAGAGLINDVMALSEPGAIAMAARLSVPVCLMHMQGTPATMQDDPRYTDVVTEVVNWLTERRDVATAAGIPADTILYDPGFGFGKRLNHNLELLQQLHRLADLGPVVAGLSRKRLIGQLLGDDQCDRLVGSVAAAMIAIGQGASIVRVHDVRETVQALAIWHESGVASPLVS